MPFDFLKKRKDEPAATALEPGDRAARSAAGEGGRGIPFDGLTDEWRIVGEMHVDGRLSDALNKREAITISNVQWAPIDGSEPMAEAPGLKAVDPYDLIMVLAGESTLPPLSEAERVAHKIHKVAYDVALELPPFRVIGTVYLFPGSEPDRLMDRATEMFVPVVDAVAIAQRRTAGGRARRHPRQSLLPARDRADRPADRASSTRSCPVPPSAS